ncbi:CAP domain-containing protein [Paracoccus rhizosphaerae]|uniref:CAP domain-containing protein n=1 Tax=Paracoccus rhizosphaerae TaxID=1133347 RepID=A0ABV6CIF7_9RHOB|nr:CAP domain-containing protein [Paracoccus rhizosphaerae]
MFRPLLVLGSSLVIAACQPQIPEPTAPIPEDGLAAMCSGVPEAGARLNQLVNGARLAEAKPALEISEDLNTIALSHACDMAMMQQADVAGSNGSNVVDRARAVGYPTCGVVQLVNVGTTPDGAVASWLIPGPQREQLLGQLSYEVGSGVARGPDGRLWLSTVMGNDCPGVLQ